MTGRRAPRARFAVARGLVLLGGLLLTARLVQIQVLQHPIYRALADEQWVKKHPVPPRRGDLFDRDGRPLALSVTAATLGVATSLVQDPAAVAAVLGPMIDMAPAVLARRIRQEKGGHLALRRDVLLDPTQLAALRRLPSVTITEGSARVYPLGGIGASLIGFFRQDPDGKVRTSGLENGLDALLAGKPGSAITQRSADPHHSLGDVTITPPVNGQNLVLTLDGDLQEICETQLTRAMDEFHAAGGSVLILDPTCGDVLAAASWPTLATRERPVADAACWNNRNFSFQYEPGSVFKIFTAASLLAAGAIDTATVIDCTSGDFGAFTIREADGHEFTRTSFMEAFAKSSNVYFARAVGNLEPAEFYRDLQTFGFGQRTSAPYPVEPAGLLHPPSAWSGRSQATMAIGQEIAVTPLQLGLAVCAVANGGVLYAPRLVREIRDHDDDLVRTCAPTSLRRVMTPALATVLRTAMARVVTDGTGEAARQDWITLAGKTGTAQKSLDGRVYAPGKYVATFCGLVPWDTPRLVIVTVLDEPPGWRHYAAQSAVPLFGWVVQEIRRSTTWLTDLDAGGVRMVRREPTTPVPVPDVLYLSSATAATRLQAAGFQVAGAERGGMIIEQVPAAGAAAERGSLVTLTVRAQSSAPQACPDLAGLSNRQVQTLAARLGITVAMDGIGYVATQSPAPGEPLPSDGLRVRMEATWR